MSKLQKNTFMNFINFNENHPLVESLQPAYYQLGFICSVQAVPAIIDLDKWLVDLWRDGNISFDNEKQATEYAEMILNMLVEIDDLYDQAMPLEQLNCMKWLGEQQQLCKEAILFASGFLAAIEVFNVEWMQVEGDEPVQNLLQTTVLLMTKLTKNENTSAELLDLFEQLPEVEEILKILPSLMSNLAYSAAQSSH